MALGGLQNFGHIYGRLLLTPLRRIYAWALPSAAALAKLAQAAGSGGVVEIGSGTGLWASLLRVQGTRVHAYDMFGSAERKGQLHWQHCVRTGDGWENAPNFTEVLGGDARACAGHPASLLLMCWPPCEDDDSAPDVVRSMACDAIRAYVGSHLALVVDCPWLDKVSGSVQAAGPRAYGALLEAGFRLQDAVALRSWPSCPAQLQLWVRQSSAPHELRVDSVSGPVLTGEDSEERQRAATATRAAMVARVERDVDRALVDLILMSDGPLLRGERVVLARHRRRSHGTFSLRDATLLVLRRWRS